MPNLHPIEKEVAALAKDGLDQAMVDLSVYLADDVPRTADLLGVKGPDPDQWGPDARAARGAEAGTVDPVADLPRGD